MQAIFVFFCEKAKSIGAFVKNLTNVSQSMTSEQFEVHQSAAFLNLSEAMKPFLRIDDHLTLHLARPEFAEPVFKIVDEQRDYLREWLPWVDTTQSVEDINLFIQESMRSNSNGQQLTTYIMNGEEVAGALGIVNLDRDHKKCELGYWLREDMQGEGIMTKACATLIDYIFRSKDIHRIEITVAVGNDKSCAVPLRLGFKTEGIHREAALMYDYFVDIEIFAILKSEWAKLEKNRLEWFFNSNQNI